MFIQDSTQQIYIKENNNKSQQRWMRSCGLAFNGWPFDYIFHKYNQVLS